MQHRRITGLCAFIMVLSLATGCGAKSASGTASSVGPSASASASASAKATASAGPSASASASSAVSTPAPAPTPTLAPTVGTVVDGWVAGIPGYVPRFACGTLDKSHSKITEGSISTAFILCFTGVAQSDVDAYADLLRQKGYKAGAAQIGDLYTLTASLAFSYGIVTVIVTLDAGGTATYALEAPV